MRKDALDIDWKTGRAGGNVEVIRHPARYADRLRNKIKFRCALGGDAAENHIKARCYGARSRAL
jgi:hypothetical protein